MHPLNIFNLVFEVFNSVEVIVYIVIDLVIFITIKRNSYHEYI